MLHYYQGHEHNLCVLFVRQDRVGADQHDRQGERWRHRRLNDAASPLAFPDIGAVGRLGDLYKFTPLDPFTGRRTAAARKRTCVSPLRVPRPEIEDPAPDTHC